MASRAVVGKPPPGAGPRRAVVLREGPPVRGKRRRLDAFIGVAGGLVLVLMVALFFLLPSAEVPLAQYEVTFEETLVEGDTPVTHAFAEGETWSFQFPYEGGNLYHVGVVIRFEDDFPSSLPDTFRVELRAPDGTAVVAPQEFRNEDPDVDATLPATYTARPSIHSITHQLAPRPTTQVITALDHAETPDAVEARVSAAHARGGDGVWELLVTLVSAGDCPHPAGFDVSRTLDCQRHTTEAGHPGSDPGNPFQVTAVIFTKYDPLVRPL